MRKVGITGGFAAKVKIGRVSRDERRAILTAHAELVNANLPEGLKVDRVGQMFQDDAVTTISFFDFADMVERISAEVAA